MKITGSATLAADPQQVWDAFHDPAVLARCLPGCERLTELGPDHYAMTVTAGVAAIKGTYDGEVSLRDPQHPGSFTMKASGAGAPGTVDADVVVRLAPSLAGGTDLTYDADASVGGVIGGVGQRMLAGVTKKMAGQFFSAVDADISGVRVPVPSAPAAVTPTAAPGIPSEAAAPVTYAGRPAPAAPFAGRDFGLGVVTGGAVALVGVVVGWAIGEAVTMRAFTAAAVQVAPVAAPLTPETIRANVEACVEMTRRCVEATGAELVVLPETASTGFTPGCSKEELWDLVTELPGAMIEPIQAVARELGVHVCFGTYERGPERGVVYNSSVLIGPTGDLLGTYRKTHPFCSEIVSGGGWVTPGDTVTVCDTELGRIGMIICFDGDYPELSRIQAVQGAEVICRPSALLRSADIWDLTSRARAYDNHVYVIGANAVGTDPAGVLYFGNSHIVTPIGHIVAKAATHPGWVTARLDPADALASLTPGSNVGQAFDHLRDRNLDLIRNHRAELEGAAETSFPHAPIHRGDAG